MTKATHLGTVLVVDDDPIVCAMCIATLRAEGWQVTAVHDGESGRRAVASAVDQFDCVVSDVNMPGLDGFAFLRAVRAHDEDVPVVLMTADPSLTGAMHAIEGGAVSYLAKPFRPDALAEAVARAARRHGIARLRRRAMALLDQRGDIPSAERADLEARFTAALRGVWMAFQPIVDATTGKVAAYEALIRTEEPSLRRPDLLLGVAERLGRMQEVGRVVRAAVAEAAAAAPPGVDLFVNLHGLELNDEELYAPASPLAGIARRVVLEITERAALDVIADARTRVAMLRRLGFRIAIDDLGAGYAGLASLAALEPDVVKLDMSLVRDIHLHPTKHRVVTAITTLCHELGCQVVAEGVETAAEHATLRASGLRLLQGYLFARPARGFTGVATA